MSDFTGWPSSDYNTENHFWSSPINTSDSGYLKTFRRSEPNSGHSSFYSFQRTNDQASLKKCFEDIIFAGKCNFEISQNCNINFS